MAKHVCAQIIDCVEDRVRRQGHGVEGQVWNYVLSQLSGPVRSPIENQILVQVKDQIQKISIGTSALPWYSRPIQIHEA